MRSVYDSSAIYAAEAELMATVPEGSLMTVASHAVAGLVRDLLGPGRSGRARVVVLAGPGNNGGDALFAGATLARRGVQVCAVTVAPQWHHEAAQALLSAGGRLVPAADPGAMAAVRGADLVVDGIVGIGATGAVRPPAAALVAAIPASTFVVSVDIPSGVDPSSGAVADPTAVVTADVTMTFGAYKAGQFLPPGRDRCGVVELVDIGLGPSIDLQSRQFQVLGMADATNFFAVPGEDDYKYSHGVLGVVAGCAQYPGAPHMVVGAARHCGPGMVRLWQNPDEPQVSAAVVTRFPDTVCTGRVADGKATAWAVGPGMGVTDAAREVVAEVLATSLPVVVDADALTLVSRDAQLREALVARAAPTVITPHVGEFARLGFHVGDDRLAAARHAAAALNVTVLLKGPGTVVADPNGDAYVDDMGTAALATAGTGDALSGVIGAALSRHPADTTRAVAAAVLVHGLAGRFGSAGDRPMTAWDLVHAIPDAVAAVRHPGG